MDKSEGQFDPNNLSEEGKDDHGEHHIHNDRNVDEIFLEFSHVSEELGFQNEHEIKRKNSYEVSISQSVHQPEAANDVTASGDWMFGINDGMEQNPNVEFGVEFGRLNNREVQNHRKRSRGPNHADQIVNTGLIRSANDETMSNQMNLLGQSIDGTQPGLNSASSSLGRKSNQRNLLVQSIDGTGLVLNSASSSLGRKLNQRNLLAQSIDGTRPVLNSASSSLGTKSNQRNVLRQSIDGTRPVLNSASSSLGTKSNQRNMLGQSIEGTQPLLNSASSSLRMMSNERNVLGQGRTRPRLSPASSSLGTMLNQTNLLGQGIVGTRPVLNSGCSSLGMMSNRMNVCGQSTNSNRTQHLNSSLNLEMMPLNQVQSYMSLSPYFNSSFFIPRGVHEHNMRTLSHPNMSSGITRARPVAEMVPPMVDMRSPMFQMMAPTVAVHPPVVQLVPPMVEMHPPVIQLDTLRDFVHDPTRPSTNSNMDVRLNGEHDVRNGEGGYSDEATSRHSRLHDDDEHGSTSRDAKRSKEVMCTCRMRSFE